MWWETPKESISQTLKEMLIAFETNLKTIAREDMENPSKLKSIDVQDGLIVISNKSLILSSKIMVYNLSPPSDKENI